MDLWLIVGLGNPGPRYNATRHNVGFEVVSRLGDRWGREPIERFQSRFSPGGTSQGGSSNEAAASAHLLAPGTYMNRSGGPTLAAVREFDVRPDRILVVYDDLDLEVGRIRLRPRGSSGGHRGLTDILGALEALGPEYERIPRLRLGVGRNPAGVAVEDYVLGRFTEEENVTMTPAIERAATAVELCVTQGLTAAMDRFNRESTNPESESREGETIARGPDPETPSRAQEARGTPD